MKQAAISLAAWALAAGVLLTRGEVRADTPGCHYVCCYPGYEGRLPPEVIQRTVRLNFGRFRGCYQEGLLRNPRLQGRVAIRFLISSDGHVPRATVESSDMGEQNVAQCIAAAFEMLRFPREAAGGQISVLYPLVLSPLDPEATK